ncbi:hypothetical protein FB45DRAFT_881848 [Roridomyces roridus]|uniref:Uncharacterized protein n=1 Tax=Roridomyces roridus TaxID=1738132 RepID=A0AAD7AXJ2_9AGAR|nr:hypothetical protein FB45DRAFT_881848 [Roridomyces roridus]
MDKGAQRQSPGKGKTRNQPRRVVKNVNYQLKSNTDKESLIYKLIKSARSDQVDVPDEYYVRMGNTQLPSSRENPVTRIDPGRRRCTQTSTNEQEHSHFPAQPRAWSARRHKPAPLDQQSHSLALTGSWVGLQGGGRWSWWWEARGSAVEQGFPSSAGDADQWRWFDLNADTFAGPANVAQINSKFKICWPSKCSNLGSVSLIIDVLGAFHLGLSESLPSRSDSSSGTPVQSLSHIAGQMVTLDLSGVTILSTFARNSGPTILQFFRYRPELWSKSSPGDFIPATSFSDPTPNTQRFWLSGGRTERKSERKSDSTRTFDSPLPQNIVRIAVQTLAKSGLVDCPIARFRFNPGTPVLNSGPNIA